MMSYVTWLNDIKRGVKEMQNVAESGEMAVGNMQRLPDMAR